MRTWWAMRRGAVVLLTMMRVGAAEPVAVRNPEGAIHGYLALRSLDGKLLAAGDLVQTLRGGRVVTKLVFHFKDGSVDDETATFTQHGHFRLLSDHHVQSGPMFKEPLDMAIDAVRGEVTVRHGETVETSHMELPEDLANGMLLDVLKNIRPDAPETKLAFVAATPKPRLVHLVVKPAARETFTTAGARNRAVRFQIHIDLGGIVGAVAPLVGKQPPDAMVWISMSEVPAFVRSQVSLYVGGPEVRMELVGAVWPAETPQR